MWEAIDWVPDMQCAWQILVQCAGPWCHHFVRTVPPGESRAYAGGHDTGMMETLSRGGLTGDEQKHVAQRIATLPMRLGGLGLRSASRMSHAAYWASWADSLQMIAQRLPTVAADQEGGRLFGRAGGGNAQVGSRTHLLLPHTITGRAWCLLSRLPRTRLIYAPTQDQAPVPSCSVARLVASSRHNWRRSGC